MSGPLLLGKREVVDTHPCGCVDERYDTGARRRTLCAAHEAERAYISMERALRATERTSEAVDRVASAIRTAFQLQTTPSAPWLVSEWRRWRHWWAARRAFARFIREREGLQ